MDAVIPMSYTAVLKLHRNLIPFRPSAPSPRLPPSAASVMLVPGAECHFLVDNTGLPECLDQVVDQARSVLIYLLTI
jgi:hypothetical protein